MEDETLTKKAEACKNKGNEQFKIGNYQAAIQFYTEAIDNQPNEPAYYTNRAIANLKIELFGKAMDDCKAALRINDKFTKAYNRMSKCYIALGDLAAASIALQKSIELEPGNPTNKKDQKHLQDLKIMEALVQKAITEERWEKAVTNLTQLMEDCSQSIAHICQKIECLMRAYKYDEANNFSAKVMKKPNDIPSQPRILCWRGRVLIYMGNEVLGKKHLQQALNFDPDLKECQQAMRGLKKAATMKESAAEVFKAGQFKEAIAKFEECLEFDPLNAAYNSTLLLNIAIAEVKLGNHDASLKALNRAIKFNPKYAKALVKRGEVYSALEDYNEAIKDFSEASDHDATGFNVQQKLKEAQAKAKKAKRKDYYKILGVPKSAQDPEIRKAYKKLALKWHPDKNAGSEETRSKADKMFKEVNEASSVLLDRDKRDKYDNGYDIDDINSGRADHGCGGGMGGMDPNDLLSMFMGAQMGGMGGGAGRGRQRGGGGPPPGFGGFGGQPGQSQQGFTFRFG